MVRFLPFSRGRGTKAGVALIEVLIIAVVLAGMALGVGYFVRQHRMLRECRNNLRRIYSALGMYEIERGTLPRLAFFPDDAKQDNDSLLAVLQPYGAGGNVCVCPASPPAHKAVALTYVWNVQLNGRKLRGGDPEWMLVEINALSPAVPAPHMGRYNILYTDGEVRLSRHPPPGLQRP